jgi:Flp pilus assembly protein TadG
VGARQTPSPQLIDSRCRQNERGQVLVLTAVWMVMLCAAAALVLDVGNWFRDKRRLQATADSAVLAGAQSLPSDPIGARGLALSYANANGGDVAAADIVITSTFSPSDTISVSAARDDPGIFSQVVGVRSVHLTAGAKARVGFPQQAKYVAPIVVKDTHPLIHGNSGCPCFNEMTTIPLSKAGAPGAFDLINLDGSRGGISPGTLAGWMLEGYQGYLDLGKYYSDPGAKFNSSEMQAALAARRDTTLLFPVYDVLMGTGANAQYNVIGWIGFHMTDYDARGSDGTLTGYFTEFIAQGILNPGGGGPMSYGVRAIQLIE